MHYFKRKVYSGKYYPHIIIFLTLKQVPRSSHHQRGDNKTKSGRFQKTGSVSFCPSTEHKPSVIHRDY